MTAAYGERCDIRIWSSDCKQDDAQSKSAKYLCKACGTLDNLEHEVSHEFYSNVSGDYHKLS